MTISVRNKQGTTLVFYDVPKNASTSVKKMFIDVLGLSDKYDFYGEQYIDKDGNRVDNLEASKEYKERWHSRGQPKGSSHQGKTLDFHAIASNSPFNNVKEPPQPGFTVRTMCVVRDPKERFVSCYNHLVLVNKEYDWTPQKALQMVKNGTMINNHFFPQTYFLGHDEGYYNYIYNTKETKQMAKDIGFFFEKEIDIDHYQTSGSSVSFPDMSDMELTQMVKEAYASDYEAFGKYF